MTDQQHERPYLPGMGRHALLPLYDPLTRLLGARAIHQRLVDQADLRPGLRVLEIGCGTGNLAIHAARQQPGSTVVGLDPDPRALARAIAKARRAGVSVTVDRGYADQLPYPSGSVDRVLSALMFHHLNPAEQPAAAAEIARVLAPGGSVHAVDLTGPAQHRLRRRRSHPNHRHDGPDLAALFGTADLADARETGHGSNLLGAYTYYRADR
jgi:ubiquinone/menaquinone biosynthesis C-methylase UbiE